MKINAPLWIAAFLLSSCFAQTDKAEESKFYRMDFTAKELEGGKVSNSRSYSMLVSNTTRGSLRVGSRLPIQMGGQVGGMVTTNIQYYDLGVNIDCKLIREMGNQLALELSTEISSVAQSDASNSSNLPPVVRQNKWSSNVVVPIGKATVIFSSDDPGSKRTMQIEVTATPLKGTQ